MYQSYHSIHPRTSPPHASTNLPSLYLTGSNAAAHTDIAHDGADRPFALNGPVAANRCVRGPDKLDHLWRPLTTAQNLIDDVFFFSPSVSKNKFCEFETAEIRCHVTQYVAFVGSKSLSQKRTFSIRIHTCFYP